MDPADLALSVDGDLVRIKQVVDDDAESLIHHLLREAFPELPLFEFAVMRFDKSLDHQHGVEPRVSQNLLSFDLGCHGISVDTRVYKIFRLGA